jgi:hypothetical protein
MTNLYRQTLVTEVKADTIAQQLLSSASSMDDAERSAFGALLCGVAQSLSPTGDFPTNPSELQYFRDVLYVLARLQNHPRMTPNGICYFGRPSFMTDELLAALRTESIEKVRPNAIWQPGHYIGACGEIALALANGEDLKMIVENHCGPVDATGVISYMFYDEEGAGIAAHVDTDIFSLNVNINLFHTCTNGQRQSKLFIFHSDGQQREEYLLEPGQMMITFGDSIVHGRTPLVEGEFITNLTIGFQPAAWAD